MTAFKCLCKTFHHFAISYLKSIIGHAVGVQLCIMKNSSLCLIKMLTWKHKRIKSETLKLISATHWSAGGSAENLMSILWLP